VIDDDSVDEDDDNADDGDNPNNDKQVTVKVLTGKHKNIKYILKAGEKMKIGRNDDAALCLTDDDYASWDHVDIEMSDDGLLKVRDVGSTNGIEIEGIKKKSRRFHIWNKGDILTVGEADIAYF
jgi:hypothetical protein